MHIDRDNESLVNILLLLFCSHLKYIVMFENVKQFYGITILVVSKQGKNGKFVVKKRIGHERT